MPNFDRLIDLCIHRLSEPHARLLVVLPISRHLTEVGGKVHEEVQKRFPEMIIQEANGEKVRFANGPDDTRTLSLITHGNLRSTRGLLHPDTDIMMWKDRVITYYEGPGSVDNNTI